MEKTNSLNGWNLFLSRLVKIILAIFLIAMVVFISMYIRNLSKEYKYIGKSAEQINTIYITGTGQVSAVPDIGKVVLGVTTTKSKIEDAQKENTDKMNAITKAIKDLGVADKDLKTANYSVYPQYDWTDNGRVLRGYEVNQTLEVKIRNLDNSNLVLSKATEFGANNISGLTFEIDDPEVLKVEARQKAIENAQTKADALAKQLGINLGRVVSYSESNNGSIYSNYPKTMLDSATGLGGAESVMPTVETGENEIKVDVNISYEIL